MSCREILRMTNGSRKRYQGLRQNRVYLIWKSQHLICRQMASRFDGYDNDFMVFETILQFLITSEVAYGT